MIAEIQKHQNFSAWHITKMGIIQKLEDGLKL